MNGPLSIILKFDIISRRETTIRKKKSSRVRKKEKTPSRTKSTQVNMTEEGKHNRK